MYDYELSAWWVDITEECLPQRNDLVRSWEIINNKKTNNIEYLVLDVIANDFILQTMAVNGVPLKPKERKTQRFSLFGLQKQEFKLLDDKSNDKSNWPKTVEEAVKILYNLFEATQIKEIEQMNWEDFSFNHAELGSLGNWIRNYFGLWRGNFDLMLDCDIAEINADNVSTHISYCFWEFIVDKKVTN